MSQTKCVLETYVGQSSAWEFDAFVLEPCVIAEQVLGLVFRIGEEM